jgi:hypothetical protein
MSTIYNYITSTGVIVPDTSSILAAVQQVWLDQFGSDLIVTSDTPQGLVIATETLVSAQIVNNNAALANSINPNIAGGVALDAIGALTLPQGRTASTPTLVSGVNLTGVAGTVIPSGTQAKTAAGDLFQSLSTVTLDMGGAASVNFASVANGAIPCAETALTTIVSNILGWETISNPTAGVLGALTQSDQSFRAYRNNTIGFQGVALPIAITSTLLATQGVLSVTFIENYNDVPVGMLVSVTGGSLTGIYGMTTTGAIAPAIIVGTSSMDFAASNQTIPTVNPWPIAAFTTSGNISLSGLSTQSGGNWTGSLTAGNIILVKNQSADSQNGVYLAASGAWTRHSYNAIGITILGAINGISLIAKSIYTCINGGADTDVAAALLENKSSGCAWNGATTVNLIEPASGQTYPVQFDRPTPVPIVIKITTTNGSTDNITQAVLNYAAGLVNGFTGFVVGSTVSPFEIAGAILSQYPSYFITQVEVSLETDISYSTDTIPIAVNQIATTQLAYITVVLI